MFNNANNIINTSSFMQNNADFSNLQNANIKEVDNLRKVTDDFEAFFLKKTLDTSFASLNIAGEGLGKDIIKGMYTDALSQSVKGGLGISSLLYEYLSKNNK